MAIKPLRRFVSATPQVAANSRVVKYKFSDSSVARDGHTISNTGWQLDNYLKNPVFLWAHDSSAPPIGKVTEIWASSTGLFGSVEYAPPDINPFADTIYQMVIGGFLNATSVAWNPIEYSYSQDKSRPGGINFTKQELLEVSQVPVPALPTALAAARARGINTQPIFEWAGEILDKGAVNTRERRHLERLRNDARMPAGPMRTAFTESKAVAERVARFAAIRRRTDNLVARSFIAEFDIEERERAKLNPRTNTLEKRMQIVAERCSKYL